MDILDKLKKKASAYEVTRIKSESTQVAFTSGKIKKCTTHEQSGVSVRGFVHGRMGFASSTKSDAEEMIIRNFCDSAELGDKIEFAFPSKAAQGEVVTYDQKIADLSAQSLADIGSSITERVKMFASDAEISIHVSRGIVKNEMKNSSGLTVLRDSTGLSVSVSLSFFAEGDIYSIYNSDYFALWRDYEDELVKQLERQCEWSRRKAEISSGSYPMILPPRNADFVLNLLGDAMNGLHSISKASPLCGKEGTRIANENFTLVDDPFVKGASSSSLYDSDGSVTSNKSLVDKGIFTQFIYDCTTAARCGTTTTANARRGLLSAPRPSFFHLTVMPGKIPLKEIYASVDEGILVHGFIGAGQGNTKNGDFSNPLGLAFKIEKGEVVGRIKNTSIAGNLYDVLPRIDTMSIETEDVCSSYESPTLLIPSVQCVSKK